MTFNTVQVIKGVTFEVPRGEFVVFVGPSGCGKSTLLRMIAGLEEISEGDLYIGDTRSNQVPPDRRGLAMVFQSYALYPHMTVAENMGFALRLQGVSKAERRAKVEAAASVLQIEPLLDRKPANLSGGQRQRVAIGRAIVRDPQVFLFDEPLSNLDAALRVRMRMELVALHKKLNTTMIYVTHDQVEAMTMADRIVVLRNGSVEQIGTPLDLYNRPNNLFVAGFIGSPQMNFLPGSAQSGAMGTQISLSHGSTINLANYRDVSGDVTLGIRPDMLTWDTEGPIKGTVRLIEQLGKETLVHVDVGGDATLTVESPGQARLNVSDLVGLSPKPGQVHLFDNAENRISPIEELQ